MFFICAFWFTCSSRRNVHSGGIWDWGKSEGKGGSGGKRGRGVWWTGRSHSGGGDYGRFGDGGGA